MGGCVFVCIWMRRNAGTYKGRKWALDKQAQQFLTCGSWPLRGWGAWVGGSKGPFTWVTYQIYCNQMSTSWFITAAKWLLWSSNKNNVMVGVSTTWGTVLKGYSIRKAESHRCSWNYTQLWAARYKCWELNSGPLQKQHALSLNQLYIWSALLFSAKW